MDANAHIGTHTDTERFLKLLNPRRVASSNIGEDDHAR